MWQRNLYHGYAVGRRATRLRIVAASPAAALVVHIIAGILARLQRQRHVLQVHLDVVNHVATALRYAFSAEWARLVVPIAVPRVLLCHVGDPILPAGICFVLAWARDLTADPGAEVGEDMFSVVSC